MPGRSSEAEPSEPAEAGGLADAGELERIALTTERVGLVIRVRWLIVVTLVAYSAITFTFYAVSEPFFAVFAYVLPPALAVLFVAGYNAWYQFTYQRLTHIRYLPHAQILLDVLVATVLVHYSGGVNSWFWTMYMLFTIEAAFILDDESDTWIVAVSSAAVYGALLTLEYYGIIQSVRMPFVGVGLTHNFTYVMILWSWVLVMNVLVALIGNNLAGALRRREQELRANAVIDSTTGLYKREQLRRTLRGEVERAKRYRRRLALLKVRIDGLEGYAQDFGPRATNGLVQLVGEVLLSSVRRGTGEDAYDLDMLFRAGPWTFAVVAPETETEDARFLGERIREAVKTVCVPRPGSIVQRPVTVSVGAVVYPAHGTDADTLIAAAAAITVRASKVGDRVMVAPT